MARVDRTLCAALLTAGMWLSSSAAAAQPAAEPAPSADEGTLADARAALEQKRFAAAVDKAAPLRRSSSRSTRAEALEIVAIGALAAGRKTEGEEALHDLYALQPGFELADPSLPEPVRRAFEAEAARPNPDRVALRVTTPAGGAPAVEVTADRPVSAVRLACRVEAGLAFAPLSITGSGAVYRGQLRSARPHACIALALDGDGLIVGREGTRAHPIEIHPASRAGGSAAGAAGADQQRTGAPPSSPALTQRWWFWTALGTLVVAGAVTVVVAAAASSDGPPSEQVGTNRPTLFAF